MPQSKKSLVISPMGAILLVVSAFIVGVVIGVNSVNVNYGNMSDIERSRRVEEYLNTNFSQENDVTYIVKLRDAHGEIKDSKTRGWRKYQEDEMMINMSEIDYLHRKFDFITEALIKNLDKIGDQQ